MIEFKEVNKSFNGYNVFKGLSFKIRKGEITGLLGPSGTGKTTILKIVANMISPDSGEVQVGSTRIGYIFQEPRLIPWKTVLENICFGLKVRGTGDHEAKKIGKKFVENLGLMGFENCYPHQLSGGMSQRVSIGRAFAIDPDILLMDEPFSALDPLLKEDMLGLIRDMLNKRTLTVMYVSHNPNELNRIARKIYMLSRDGDIKEVQLNGKENEQYYSDKEHHV